MNKIYLAGSITSDPDPQSWRKKAQELLKPKYNGLNPLDFTPSIADHPLLVDLDLFLIDQSSAIILNAGLTSWGSAMEIFYAKTRVKIPVVAFNIPSNASPWLLSHLDVQCDSLENSINVIKNMVGCDD